MRAQLTLPEPSTKRRQKLAVDIRSGSVLAASPNLPLSHDEQWPALPLTQRSGSTAEQREAQRSVSEGGG
jgi:hypothetical protein